MMTGRSATPATKDVDRPKATHAPNDFAPQKGMSKAQIADTVEAILKEATLEEKVAMMSGAGFYQAMIEDGMRWSQRPYRAGAGCDRLGVPALYFSDGPRGVARGSSTCFPVSIARGASWDRALERRIGEAMGVEMRAQGCNLSGAVCVNILRHPGWGRAQETYGEDPYHVGEMGAALSEGVQSHNVIATVKHLAVNSLENSRFKVDVRVDGRTLREVYLPHFKRVLDSGCASVMSAYNKLNGEYCGQHYELLTKILREEWGFDGFVHSDWIMGVHRTYGAAAGLDIENPEPAHFGEKLVAAVRKGEMAPAVVDTACRRILTTLYRFACAEDPYEEYTPDMVASDAHVALAREAAEKSAVLLKNDNSALPLAKDARIGVFGKLATAENTGDHGSSRVRAPYVVTALQGLSAYLDASLELAGDESDVSAAGAAAKKQDAAIIVVGTTAADEGEFIPGSLGSDAVALLPKGAAEALTASRKSIEKEVEEAGALGTGHDRGGDRDMLRLPDDQIALIRAVAKSNPNTIVVIVSGSAIISTEWADDVAGILQTFYSGMEGGAALARLLFGEISPSGKLPFTVAKDEKDYPFFDKNADSIEYGPLHGYSLMKVNGIAPQFAFGHGLSYTQFAYRSAKAHVREGRILAEVSVANTGAMNADEIVQLYVGFPNKAVDRPASLLHGFERIHIKAGEQRIVRFSISLEELRYWDDEASEWRFEPGDYQISIGPSADAQRQLHNTLRL